jgi:hypothetical protein
MAVAGATPQTEYERNQVHSAVVSWLHSHRYKNILRVFEAVAREVKGRPIRVVDIGCAHAKLYQVLDERFDIEYTGIDPEPTLAAVARERYGNRPNFTLLETSALETVDRYRGADVVAALETLEHIPEHEVVRLVEAVAQARPRRFVCSVPVEIGPTIWLKNVGSWVAGYVRHTEYEWKETFWAGLYRLDKLPPHAVRHKGFDWRWLAQTIRHNLRIVSLQTLPYGFVPSAFSTSVFIVAEPRDPS